MDVITATLQSRSSRDWRNMSFSSKTKTFICEVCGTEGLQNAMGAKKRFCKDCYGPRAEEIEYNRVRSKEYKAYEFERNLRLKYGITVECFEELFKRQNGVCAICQNPETAHWRGKLRTLSVDHDHKTGRVRGLLCRRCNMSLGQWNDDPSILYNAIKYLEESKLHADAMGD